MKNKIKLIIIVMILLLLGGVSFAFFAFSKTSITQNKVITGKIYLKSTETNVIQKSEMYPMSDIEGMSDGVKYSFTINGYNSSSKDIYYGIYLNDNSDIPEGKSAFDAEDVKVVLKEKIDGTENVVFGPGTLDEFNNTLIYASTVNGNMTSDEDIVRDYELTAWIDEKVLISDTENPVDKKVYTQDEFKDKILNFNVEVLGDFEEKDVNLNITVKGEKIDSHASYDLTKSYDEVPFSSENIKVTINTSNNVNKIVIKNNATNEIIKYTPTNNSINVTYSSSGSYTYYGINENEEIVTSIGTFNIKIDKVSPTFIMESGEEKEVSSTTGTIRITNEITINDDGKHTIEYAIVDEGETPDNYRKVEGEDNYTISFDKESGVYDLVVRVTDEKGNVETKRETYILYYKVPVSTNGYSYVTSKTTQKIVNGKPINYLESLENVQKEEFFGYALDSDGVKMVTNSSLVNEKINTIYMIWQLAHGATKPNTSFCNNPTYNGEIQDLTKNSSTGYTFINNKGKNAGNYSVIAKLDENYVWEDDSTNDVTIECSISKREIAYQSDSSSKDYDGTALTKNTATLKSGTLAPSHTVSFVITGTQINAGNSANTLSNVIIKDGSGNDVSSNYTITKTSGTLTVNPKNINLSTIVDISNSTYTGNTITPDINITDLSKILVKDTDYIVSYSNNINAGTANLTITGKGNYTGTKNTTFVIDPAPLSVTWGNVVSWPYDGNSHVPTITSVSGATNETINLSVSGEETNAGIYVATASCSSVTGGQGLCSNYSSSPITQGFEITKVDGSVSCIGRTYNGSSQTIASGSGCSSIANTNVTNAGNYTVTCNGDSNHNSYSTSCTMAKAASSVSCIARTYSGSDQTIASGSGCSSLSNATKKNAGTYTVTCTGDSNHNNSSNTCIIEKFEPKFYVFLAGDSIPEDNSSTNRFDFDANSTKVLMFRTNINDARESGSPGLTGTYTLTSSNVARLTFSGNETKKVKDVDVNTYQRVDTTHIKANTSLTIKFVPSDTTNFETVERKVYFKTPSSPNPSGGNCTYSGSCACANGSAQGANITYRTCTDFAYYNGCSAYCRSLGFMYSAGGSCSQNCSD